MNRHVPAPAPRDWHAGQADSRGTLAHGHDRTVLLLGAEADGDDLRQSLASLGYTVVSAGLDGISAATAPSFRCQTAIVRLQDGCPVEALEPLARRCPVVVLGDDQSFPSRLAAARAGVRTVLTTPVDMIELAAWLEDFTEPHGQTPSILVVDDDELLAETYALALTEAGMNASVVTDPARVMEHVAVNIPDLVLMDMHMPDVDGIELAQVLRQSRRYLSLPVVFLSAERDQEKRNLARRLGGDEFIDKSTDLQQLVSIVRLRAERAIALRSVMERDSLTGLFNHARINEQLALEVERSGRTGTTVSVALLDLDHFKAVNDTYGHQVGDLVIQSLARTLIAGLRRIDIIGRYGGEEFAVVLLDTPADTARLVLDKIRIRFAQMQFRIGESVCTSSFSAGIAASDGRAGPLDLVARADEALYAAKRAGRNRIHVAAAGPEAGDLSP